MSSKGKEGLLLAVGNGDEKEAPLSSPMGEEDEEKENASFDGACKDMWDSVKSDDYDGFCASLRLAIETAK